ncbi:disease resistance protein RGA2-like [Triticum aestivum]|uniref:disease resistance protein RGA2-like n=1 Tax=Triticum aestivum TaxID=4565 RepID=UPI001D00734D|nr:disease resistance protein RGA2-like [Triticum aestivum]
MTELVATIVVGPLLSIVKDKASSYHLDKYKVMNGMEEQHKILKRKLPAILDIITDAEQTAAHREGATAWLEEVKTVAYQANEVFDEFKYEALRREAKKEGHYNKLGFDVDIEVLVAEMNAFGFKYQQRSPLSTKLRQTDHVIFDPEKITIRSREKDYKNIINILVGQANNADLTVVPIVGMGGLGKTTLAQLVYNEPEIEKHFDVLLWVCVSECFDADSLARSIVEAALEKKDNGTEAAPRKKRDDTEASTDSKKKTLLDSLQHVVSGQRYLLVWDDIWARQVHIWEQLKACLQHGGMVSVMEKECALATEETSKIECVVATEEPSQSEWLPNTARHLFLSCEEPERKLNSYLEKSSPVIQTLLCDSYVESSFLYPAKSSSLQHLAKCSSLQAFQLCSYKSSFPLKSKYLHHLRYLDLSRSYIKALPEDMSILYNLQTLNLSGCKYLCGLPSQMKYMTALRHLFTHGCPQLKSMPRDLRKLTALQTLTCFVVVSGSNCSNVGELRNLNLGGQLELHHLANVTEKDAKAANLIRKNELRELTLRWTVGQDHFSRETSHEDDARVLEKLKPHNGLRAIRIYSYRATTFPTGMAMLQNIVEIHVCHCKKLQWLFSRNSDTSFAFPNLKELTLDSLVSLERWWEINNDVIQREEIMFPRLEKLCISQCEKLTALPGQPTFPNLQNACIERCPEYLTTRVKSPNLSVLTMQGREIHVFQWVARHMTSLINLELHSLEDSTETTSGAAEHGLREVLTFDGKKNWRGQDFPLAVLVLVNFRSGVTELCACFVHLQGLRIWGCALVHWPAKEFQGLVFLRRLQIECCDDLTGYAQASAELSTSPETTLQLLPRLESLEIRKCDNLVEVFNVPASQRRMIICDCSKLESPFGRRLQQGQSAPSIHQGSSSVLEKLRIESCHGLTGVLHLPQSLKDLEISYCVGLTSLGSCSGELPSLERLYLASCNIVSSLPDGPQAYSSLQELVIVHCPAMKTLPASLQQQLCSLQREHVDAHYYGKPMLLKSKTWKYVCKG